jgi:YXWGXW repeat-containing protein
MRKSYFIPFLLVAILFLAIPASSPAQVSVGISVHVGPPALPVYAQPICPGAGYVWTPGYWAYGPDGYYWVPGTWVLAPVGMLWTPGYWGWGSGAYLWHAGYWGPHVGFYGGINYGFGYGGVGFGGGRWNGGVFVYNSAVTHVDTTVIHNTYVDKTVIVNNTTVNRVSYNGGQGGVAAAPNAEERAAMNEHHTAPISSQVEHEHAASTNHAFLASENHGHPDVAATAHPGQFSGNGVVASHGSTAFHPPANNERGGPNGQHAGNNGAPHPDVHQDKPVHNNPPHNPPKNENHDNRDNHGDEHH